MPDVVASYQAARCKSCIQAWQSRCHVRVIKLVLAILDLDPVEVLHALDFVIIRVLFIIIVFERPYHRLIHILDRLLIFIYLNLMLLQIGSDLFQNLPDRFEVHIEVSLHWSIVFHNDFLDKLLLEILQFQFWAILFHLFDLMAAGLYLVCAFVNDLFIAFNLFFETDC